MEEDEEELQNQAQESTKLCDQLYGLQSLNSLTLQKTFADACSRRATTSPLGALRGARVSTASPHLRQCFHMT